MADTLYQQFENENSRRNYPFSSDSSLAADDGRQLPLDFAVDAAIYTYDSPCKVVSISGTSVQGVCSIVVQAGQEVLNGRFDGQSKSIDLADEYGRSRGTIVLGAGAAAVASDPSDRRYKSLEFSSSCQVVLGDDFVNSVIVGDVSVHGDVRFIPQNEGRTLAKAVMSENSDGSTNLQFDVVSNTGLSALSNTGIRTIHILRKPGSMFNVIEKDGNPYLFLTKTGLMGKNSLIDRATICAKANNASAKKDDLEKSSKEDCGMSGGNSDISDSLRCQPFGTSWKKTQDFVSRQDPYSTEAGSIKGYGYFVTASDNGYGTNPSMSVMFIEGSLSVSFVVFNYAILASVNYRMTEAAAALFYELGHNNQVDLWNIPIKHTAYRDFYDYFYTNRHGKLGFVDRDFIVDVCKSKGWYAEKEDIVFPDGIDTKQYYKDITDELRSSGFSKEKPLYTIRARDFFEHFDCKNWEVSSSDFLGDEVRWLVGWGPRTTGGYFSEGSSFSYLTLSDKNTGDEIKIPKWMAARAVWWHKYSKRGRQARHFIVPKERGLTIYTGSYESWYRGVSPGLEPYLRKETSPSSWDCGNPPHWQALGLVTQIARNDYYLWLDDMVERLHKEYPEGFTFDNEPADSITFYKMNYDTLEKVPYVVDADSLDRTVLRFSNRVTSETLVVQPDDAPIYAENAEDSYRSNSYWLGPFEYEYDKLYVPGQGYPEQGDDDWKEAEAIKAPIAFQFDITKNNKNAFNIDTTDLTADGVSYQNPIHIKASESVSSPPKLDMDDPTDSNEVSDKVSALVNGQTTGNGIEISIPGLQ